MTREEEIKIGLSDYKDVVAYGEHVEGLTYTREDFYRAGANWADEHPKSPWISVKDRLPEVGKEVFIRVYYEVSGGGEREISEQFLTEKYNGAFICDRMEQHRIGGILFDTISKTTHWMPIPELPKED